MTSSPSGAAPVPPAAPPPVRTPAVTPLGLAALDWLVSVSFVVAIILAVTMAASDRIFLLLFTFLEGIS